MPLAKTDPAAEKARASLRHKDGCPTRRPVPEEGGTSDRVETYRAVRPGRTENRDGMAWPVPPQPLVVAHCCECGNMHYVEER